TGGSARRSSLRPLTRSSTSYVKAPPQPDAPSTTSNSLSRLASSSPTISKKPDAATPRATPLPSEPWGRRRRTFTTKPSPRQGYADDVAEVQRLWLAGDREAARARVPTAIGLDTNLIGDDKRIIE